MASRLVSQKNQPESNVCRRGALLPSLLGGARAQAIKVSSDFGSSRAAPHPAPHIVASIIKVKLGGMRTRPEKKESSDDLTT
jgi:hypothetical protein